MQQFKFSILVIVLLLGFSRSGMLLGQDSPATTSPSKDSTKEVPALQAVPGDDLRAELDRHRAMKGTGQENIGLMRKLRLELARRGDRKERDAIFAELKSKDMAVQFNAIVDVAALEDREAIRKLGEMLEDPGEGGRYITIGSNGESIKSSQSFPAPSLVASIKLAKLIDNPPVPPIGESKKFYTQDDVQVWKEWWKVNKESYAP